MKRAAILGTGFYVPPEVVTNDELAQRWQIDTTDEWIQRRTGIQERHFAQPGVGTADLAYQASTRALAAAGVGADELDLIVLATLSPEWCFPGSGVLLQRLLSQDLDQPAFVPALDVRNQCSGFLYGLSTGAAWIQGGAAQRVLVVGAETHSHALDLSTRGRTVATLFGDGAGAVVLGATDENRGVLDFQLGADGHHAEVLCQRVWDITQRPYIPTDAEGRGVVEPEMLWAHMDGRTVFRHATQRMVEVLTSLCTRQGMRPDQLDLVLFHQANRRINEHVAHKLGLTAAQVPHNIDRYGNTTAATLPILLAEAEQSGTLKPGMRIALVAFGSGFTWGAALVDW